MLDGVPATAFLHSDGDGTLLVKWSKGHHAVHVFLSVLVRCCFFLWITAWYSRRCTQRAFLVWFGVDEVLSLWLCYLVVISMCPFVDMHNGANCHLIVVEQ